MVININGAVTFTVTIDGYAMTITLHPCGADVNTANRALCAMNGALMALEDSTWQGNRSKSGKHGRRGTASSDSSSPEPTPSTSPNISTTSKSE